MKVVILCGGLGTRIREHNEVLPKPMVVIGDKPILEHVMGIYTRYGFKDFVLCVGYKGDIIRNYFLQYDLLHSDFTVEFNSKNITIHPNSYAPVDWRVTIAETGLNTMTGGRIKRIEKYIDEDAFMVTYGDGVADVEINELLRFHKASGKIATVTGVRPPARFGELEIDGERAVRFNEKPQAHEGWINGGFFVFNRRVFDYFTGDDCVLEREPLERLAEDGQLAVYKHYGYWQCMDTPRDVETLQRAWASGEPPWYGSLNRTQVQG